MAKAATNVLLAAKWDDSIDPTGYFMSEKFVFSVLLRCVFR